jgi:hypothetical protein
VEVEVEVEEVNLEAVKERAPLVELRLSVELDPISCDQPFFIGQFEPSRQQHFDLVLCGITSSHNIP